MANSKIQKKTVWPITLYFGVDLVKTCTGWYQKTGNMYEINGSIDIRNVLLDVDYGFGEIQYDKRKLKGSFSHTDGHYFRIGFGYNFLTPTLDYNQFFIGMRYARSFFSFRLKSDKLQCNHEPSKDCKPICTAPIVFRNLKGSGVAHWWELVVGGKVRLVSIASIGCAARYKFGKKIENKLDVLPFDMPGFGLSESKDAFGYSLYIIVAIPLQKSRPSAKIYSVPTRG
ncbi:DUF6048 family protein [Cardinium endosymbiont of Tipula unca]|uniref:DUF6048 family protein n=1 Tax=Cardinium endosymbiont of Tipula unca TaxID=3066216 RepID=UPI0030CF5567